MQQPTTTVYTVSDILQWHESGQLEIQPKFQRRDVWVAKAKSYLIDTILRAMPIPPVFIRLTINPATKRTVRQVIDGQQRLRATLGYIRGEFPVLKVHNPEFAGMTFADLPEEVQSAFLSYKFVVSVVENISDADVLSIFARMNTYTVKLNAQELRNAEFLGNFRQTVYQISHEHYTFWRNSAILKDSDIARMIDAELVSELVVSMLDGIRQTKDKDLRIFYKKYDDDFPQADKIHNEFSRVIDMIGDIYGDRLRISEFRRAPLFYSLFCALYDARFGLPGSNERRLRLSTTDYPRILERSLRLDGIIKSEKPPRKYAAFIDATRLSTADVGKRRLRHTFLWRNVLEDGD